MKQDKLIQIKVSKRFKNMLKQVAKGRGLPLSTYIKFVLSEELKKDPVWNEIEEKQDQSKHIQNLLQGLDKSKKKKISKRSSKAIISKLKK